MQKTLSEGKQSPSKKMWQAHLQAWAKSGLSGVEYCRQQHLSYHAFNYWKKKSVQFASASGVNFVPVSMQSVQDEVSAESIAALKVEFGGRFKVAVYDGFCAQTLARLISALEGYK